MTRLEIAQRRLISQRLVGSKSKDPSAAVQWLVAVQAQDYLSAKWALGLRLRGVTNEKVEQAFTEGAVLRTHLLRPTWHFVTPADIRWLLVLTAPRVHAANAYMYGKLNLDVATFKRSDAALTRALQGGQQLTRDELRVALDRTGIRTDGELRLSYLMMRAELDGLVCSGPRRAKQFTYALLDERVPPGKNLTREEALVRLALRYFSSRGPATLHDFAKWSGLTVKEARAGLEGVQHDLSSTTLGGSIYWFVPSNTSYQPATSSVAHLLSIYDEYISGYKDRSAIVSADNGRRLQAMGNALSHIVVVDSQIVGTWKRTLDARAVHVQADFFRPLTRKEKQAVSLAIRVFGAFYGRPVSVMLQ